MVIKLFWTVSIVAYWLLIVRQISIISLSVWRSCVIILFFLLILISHCISCHDSTVDELLFVHIYVEVYVQIHIDV